MGEPDHISRLAAVAARMSVMAEGPGASFIPAGDHVHDTKAPTTGTGEALLDELKRRAARARSPGAMRELVEWAEREVEARLHTPPKPARKIRDRVLEDYEGVKCRAVAEMEGVSHVTVWRWRTAAGLDEDGKPPQTG